MRNWGYLDQTSALQAALGTSNRVIHAILPPGVAQISTDMYGASGRLILLRRHTLLPYALSATPPAQAKQVVAKISAGTDSDLVRLLHLTSISTGFPQSYQYCLHCVEDEIEKFAEPYWHRMHQLGGISHCQVHGRHLSASNVPLVARRPAEMLAASTVVSLKRSESKVPVVLSREVQDQLLALAAGYSETSRFGNNFSLDSMVSMLRKLGYAAPRGQIRASALSADFRSFLRRHARRSTGLAATDWWRPLFTEVGGIVTPLQRHLFMIFLKERLTSM